jgi:hypothetical protein
MAPVTHFRVHAGLGLDARRELVDVGAAADRVERLLRSADPQSALRTAG